MSFDPITLALAKKYTDEKAGGGGGSGAPRFDLREMGLGAVPVGLSGRSAEGDFTELRNAMRTNSVWVTFNVNMGAEAEISVLLNSICVDALGVTQGTGIFYNQRVYLCMVFIDNEGLHVQMPELTT